MKILTIVFLTLALSPFNALASPAQVAANIYNEYLQVIEMIRILDETKKQLDESYKQVQNFSGLNNYIESQLEKKLKNWNPPKDGQLASHASIGNIENQVAQAHFGLYSAPQIEAGVVYNDDLKIEMVRAQ